MSPFPFTKRKKGGVQPERRGSSSGGGESDRSGASIAYRVLLRPHVTEKAGRIASMNQYVFVVSERATKPEIAQAVFEAYGIRPVRVRVLRVPRKRRRLGASQGFIPGYRKAIVTLPEGQTIEVLPK